MSKSLDSRASKDPRRNKLYRCPPTPPPEDLLKKEKSFILDGNAVSSISSDYSRANPKLGPVIPPYNSQRDRHVRSYFGFQGVNKTLKRTEQFRPGTSIEGPVMDRFHQTGAGYQYIHLRNKSGAGNSHDLVDGHAQFMQGVKPVIGYNGVYGFRRNTFWLRNQPSPFGVDCLDPIH